jgi:transcriptional regulator of NAD metabolism
MFSKRRTGKGRNDMTAAERRAAILELLRSQQEPVNATALARQFSVSRQIIVGDVALLRAAGENVLATPRGYLLSRKEEGVVRRIACLHREEDMVKELEICVDHGCTVQDVIVEHPVYGQLVGGLELSSRYDVEQFARRLERESAHSLSELTDGIHLHTLRCPSEAAYERVCQLLEAEGFLIH